MSPAKGKNEAASFRSMFRKRNFQEIQQAITTLNAMQVKMSALGLSDDADWARDYKKALVELDLKFFDKKSNGGAI